MQRGRRRAVWRGDRNERERAGELLAEHVAGAHSVAIYRAPEDMLVVVQQTPAHGAPLLGQNAMRGKLPSEAFAKLSGRPAPVALLDAERELGIDQVLEATRASASNEEEVGAEDISAVRDESAPVIVTRDGSSDFLWFSTNFCANRADIRAVLVPEPPVTPLVAWALPSRTSNTVRREQWISWGYVAGFNMGTSGTIVTHAKIDGQWGQGLVTSPRMVQQQWWFAGWREVCGPFGLGCFKIPTERTFEMGITGFDGGDLGSVCGFYWK